MLLAGVSNLSTDLTRKVKSLGDVFSPIVDERGLKMPEILGKSFQWNQEKNEQLRTERKISFEVVISSIQEGNLIDTIQHPNQEKYPNQRIFIVEIDCYIYLIPFVENDTEFFLKTIIPSRKMKKQYLGE